MGSDDKYINKPDDFSRKVGEKLREHRLPVDPGVWDSLRDRLLPREKRIPAYWSWVAAGVAAVALVLLFLLTPLVDEPLLTQHSQSEKQIKQEEVVPQIIPEDVEQTDKKSDLKQIVEEKNTKPEKIVEPVETSAPKRTSKPEKRRLSAEIAGLTGISKPVEITESEETTKSEEVTEPGKIVDPERPAKAHEVTELAEALKPEETSDPEKNLYPEEPAKSETKGLPVEEFLVENDLSSPVQEQRGLGSLIAALGSGGIPLDFSFGGYDPDDVLYDTPFPGGEFTNGDGLGLGNKYNLLAPNDYTDIEHRLPVSFSLTADFPINKKVSLETGLSYTYLFSRFRRDDNLIYRGTLRQHYIGIPVNLRYTVWQNEVWNVYLLGGGSIEKGLRSVYKQEIEYNDGTVHHSNVYSGIDGFQFSAQGGAGFSYRLQGNLSLFGEPRIIYYFRNNQPMSARTENPWIFGLNMGIRLQFK